MKDHRVLLPGPLFFASTKSETVSTREESHGTKVTLIMREKYRKVISSWSGGNLKLFRPWTGLTIYQKTQETLCRTSPGTSYKLTYKPIGEHISTCIYLYNPLYRNIPSGKLLHSYWTWSFRSLNYLLKMMMLQFAMLVYQRVYHKSFL